MELYEYLLKCSCDMAQKAPPQRKSRVLGEATAGLSVHQSHETLHAVAPLLDSMDPSQTLMARVRGRSATA